MCQLLGAGSEEARTDVAGCVKSGPESEAQAASRPADPSPGLRGRSRSDNCRMRWMATRERGIRLLVAKAKVAGHSRLLLGACINEEPYEAHACKKLCVSDALWASTYLRASALHRVTEAPILFGGSINCTKVVPQRFWLHELLQCMSSISDLCWDLKLSSVASVVIRMSMFQQGWTGHALQSNSGLRMMRVLQARRRRCSRCLPNCETKGGRNQSDAIDHLVHVQCPSGLLSLCCGK